MNVPGHQNKSVNINLSQAPMNIVNMVFLHYLGRGDTE